jgi:hypothetical protein
MPMSDDNLSIKHQLGKAVIEQMLKVDEAFEWAESERVGQGLTADTHSILHGRVFSYYRSVKRCLDMFPKAEELWQERGLDRYEKLRSQRQTVMQNTPGRGHGKQQASRSVPLEYQTLDEITDHLDDVASHLAESTHRTEINDELIEEVEEWRQRNLEA